MDLKTLKVEGKMQEKKEVLDVWELLQALFHCKHDCPGVCLECLFFAVAFLIWQQQGK
ncbi:MAG: hypothetical protein PHE77_00075 [Candidatus Pacebacteria bacterium]|nr:hypothetical protein [Candidatus Paceibacterota bacterium]